MVIAGCRDGRILNQHIKPTELVANPFRRRSDRPLIRHVELDRNSIRPQLVGGDLASFNVARSEEYGQALARQLLGDLKADALVGACDQCDELILHDDLLIGCCQRRGVGLLRDERSNAPPTYGALLLLQVDAVSEIQQDDQRTETRPEASSERRLRADAQRSVDALMAAARELFATTGVDATTREIADRAGVGMGTLYRRFPTRADLIAAVFDDEMDACAEAATTFAAQYPPFEALAKWMQVYARFVGTKQGLAKALSSGDPVFVGVFARFDQRLRPAALKLYEAAAAAGEAWPDKDAAEILCAVSTLCMSTYDGKPDHAVQMTALLVEGLRRPH